MSIHFDELILDDKYGYIFENDKAFFEKNLKNEKYWDNDAHRPDKKCFQLSLLPQPITGDIDNAKVFLLNLNPSFAKQDYEDEVVLKPYLEDTLNMDYNGCLKDYPFYFLNPELENLGGAAWWFNGRHGSHHFKSYLDAGYKAKDLAKKFCCIELIPYHARTLPISSELMAAECPSSIKVREYVKNNILPKAKRKEIVIICLRAFNEWGISEDPSNNVYITSNRQTANFSLNGKYSSVVKKLLEK